MMKRQLSKNFSTEEAMCHCGCGLVIVNFLVVDLLELIRADMGNKPVIINSWTRCQSHNANPKVGGAPTSDHLTGSAADAWIKGVRPLVIYQHLDILYPDTLSLGLYDTFVHVGARPKRARWDHRTK